MRLAITCNGPGETAGWLRPLLRELYVQAPQTDVHVFYVPDDYATGAEPEVARKLFPQAHVYDPGTYMKMALGRKRGTGPEHADIVLYLGGDLMHAARLRSILRSRFASYRFTRRSLARFTERAFAIDKANAEKLIAGGMAAPNVRITGNLAIDGAFIEAAAEQEPGTPQDGILFMPGSRDYEVANLVPFFFTAALAIRQADPNIAIAFGISPFTSFEELEAAITGGGIPEVFAQRGLLAQKGHSAYLTSLDGAERFPVLRNSLAAATAARLVVTFPGTKIIELAALGKPALSCSLLNKPEAVTINGPLTYLNRIPVVGAPLKRAIVTKISRRFRFHSQPNIDAGREIVRELHGTLTPGRVARVALELWGDTAWQQRTSPQLKNLYSEHAGAAQRLTRELLEMETKT